mgnify:CR=1 FL=1
MKVGIKNILTLIVMFTFTVNQNLFLYAASTSKKEAVFNRVLGYGTLASVDAVLWKLAKKKELGTLSDDGDLITAKFIAKKLLKTSLKPKAFVEILKRYPRTSSAVLLLEALCAIGVIDSTRGVVKFVKYRNSEERIDDQISQAEKRLAGMAETHAAETKALADKKKKIEEEYDKKIKGVFNEEYKQELLLEKQIQVAAIEFKEKMGSKQFIAAKKEVASLYVKKADYRLKKAEQKKDKTGITEACLECFEKQLKVISDNKMDPVERVDEFVEVIKRRDAYIESLDSDSEDYEKSRSDVNGKIQERIETLIGQPDGSEIIEALLGSSKEALGILHGVVGDIKPFAGTITYPVEVLTFKDRLRYLSQKEKEKREEEGETLQEDPDGYPQLEKLCDEQDFIDMVPLQLGMLTMGVQGNVASLEKVLGGTAEEVADESAEADPAVAVTKTPVVIFQEKMAPALVTFKSKVQNPAVALATAREAAQITLAYSRLSEDDKATVKSGVNKKIWDKADSVLHDKATEIEENPIGTEKSSKKEWKSSSEKSAAQGIAVQTEEKEASIGKEIFDVNKWESSSEKVVVSAGVKEVTDRIVKLYKDEELGLETFAKATISAAKTAKDSLDAKKGKVPLKKATDGLVSAAVNVKSLCGQFDEKGIKALPLLDELDRFVDAKDPVGYLKEKGEIKEDNLDDVRLVLQRKILAKQEKMKLKEQLRKQLKEKGVANGDDAPKGKHPDSAEAPEVAQQPGSGVIQRVRSRVSTAQLLQSPAESVSGLIRSATIGDVLPLMSEEMQQQTVGDVLPKIPAGILQQPISVIPADIQQQIFGLILPATPQALIPVVLPQIQTQPISALLPRIPDGMKSKPISDVLRQIPETMRMKTIGDALLLIPEEDIRQQISSSILGIEPAEVDELKTFTKSIWPVQVYTQLRQLAVTITSPGANKLAPSLKPFSILRTGEKVPAAPSAVPIEDDDLE